ncbi:MAG: heme ABC transporter ATP-binding protein [Pseudomonadota bacterium]
MLVARGVAYSIKSKPLLRATDFSLQNGELKCIIGPNGAGKSTLLGLLTGEIVPSDGLVELDGISLRNWRPDALALRRAVVPQATELAFPFTVREVAGLGARTAGGMRSAADEETAVDAALEQAGLSHIAERSYTALSGGERQRTHLARALCQLAAASDQRATRYLLLDEPTASLDLGHQLVLMDEVSRLKVQNIGVVAIVHDLNLAARFADEIVLMAAGQIVKQGPPLAAVDDTTLSKAYDCYVRANKIPDASCPFVLPQVCERS